MPSVSKPILFAGLMLMMLRVSTAATHLDALRVKQKAQKALTYCKEKGYNTKYCILIDMSLPSGVKRFAVWDYHKNDTLLTGLVSHGCGHMPWSWM